MKRSELLSHVQKNLGARANDITTYGLDWLNFALEDTAAIRNWRSMKKIDETIRTRLNGEWYPLPKRVKDILDCSYIDESSSKPLIYTPPEFFRKQFPNPDTDGSTIPDIYTWEGDHIRLYAQTSEIEKMIRLYCVKWPEPFNNTVDEENPLEKLDSALIALATAYGARANSQWERGNRYAKQYWLLVKQRAKWDGNPSDWTPQWGSQVTDNWRARIGFRVNPVQVGVVHT